MLRQSHSCPEQQGILCRIEDYGKQKDLQEMFIQLSLSKREGMIGVVLSLAAALEKPYLPVLRTYPHSVLV